ncbi:LSU ribosomal protein L1p (L10Ae) [Candidatus Portiera aleyrodidarum BT-B-HRs]|uniref:hypothetical protein n=1 Tax=Candidatus Portiera aleyrodidarum TaxID=91844 RepID=UPI00027B3059|nr:hypothetical protein [Candidatus Portiera aleyrodidarum]AFQ24035.1 ribosomal protein L1 [Candidatus Portiera aleyrodidarum BT-B-HRs]AFT80706.1 LSU ribosomal protein L1p (L10Ae) [Candidatus Portiera aleyrodidarum BT-B-HRs]ASX27162.1 50S ribosomal protein L1 [Candidatus Portiera aleyrodidarum MED (Bemisia tabaci)]
MGPFSKRKKIIQNNINKHQNYKIKEAIEQLKKYSLVNFVETVEVVIKLGKKKVLNKVIKNTLNIPYGLETNKKNIVFVKTKELKENEIKSLLKLGVDTLSLDEINNAKNKYKIHYILCESKSADILRQAHLKAKVYMINNENLTKNILNKVNEIKKGKITYCVNKHGRINTVIGKITFSIKEIKRNLKALIKDALIKKSVCNTSNISDIYISTTMGPALRLDKCEVRFL